MNTNVRALANVPLPNRSAHRPLIWIGLPVRVRQLTFRGTRHRVVGVDRAIAEVADSLTFLNRAFKTSILPRWKLAAYMKFLRSPDATANPLVDRAAHASAGL